MRLGGGAAGGGRGLGDGMAAGAEEGEELPGAEGRAGGSGVWGPDVVEVRAGGAWAPGAEGTEVRAYPADVRAAVRHPLAFLASARPWRCLLFVLAGLPLGLTVLAGLAAVLGVALVLTPAGIGLLVPVGCLLLGLPTARIEARRLRLLGVRQRPPRRRLPRPGRRGWSRARLGEPATWWQCGYALVPGTLYAGAGAVLLALLALAGVLLVTPLVVWALSPETVMILPGRPAPGGWAGLWFTGAGLVLLVVLAWPTLLLAAAEARLARAMLAPRAGDRVVELTRSRVRLADSFEAERRRIERDLHDGAQQQLVALTMTLGLARSELGGDEAPGAALVERARDEARRALEQLRELVRGIHPQVLTDHGLAAAVEEVALGGPLPVRVDIALPHRLPARVESTAYFTIAEALTNAVRHGGGTQAAVSARLRGGRLVLRVWDDGVGGADPAAGSGLLGLAERLAVLDGRLEVSSPKGGPTEVRAEVPCEE
ncbi:sensor domain-containing protein [Streptomyces sp. NRRL F-5630]|uniref:sensor histidine kinase n=1 Tax=Streptomyces sp. NRRL F-5630 TaxID=1463864 RepID=UPI003D709FF7